MVSIPNPEAKPQVPAEKSTSEAESKKESPQQQDGADRVSKPLDIIFLQDTTGSQGPYIVAARKAIRGICDKISTSADISKELIRFGLIAFRDHPPQDQSYVTKNFGFTSDMVQMERNLASLIASGGGDGPEAQTAAIAEALNTEWTEDAMKIVILITDAPPHGLGEVGDRFDKSPDQNDPLDLARQMAERGITLFLIACEPTLSQSYTHALDFYTALTEITSGRVFPLLMADKLGDYIVGTVVETIETEKLIDEFEKVIVDDVYNQSKPMESVAQNLQQFIAERGTKLTSMNIEDIYTHSAQAEKNRRIWGSAPSLAAGRGGVIPVREPRIQEKYALETPSTVFAPPPFAPLSGGGGYGGGHGGYMRGSGRRAYGRGGLHSVAASITPAPIAAGGGLGSIVPPPPPPGYGMPLSNTFSSPASASGSESFYVKAPISDKQATRIVQQAVSRSSKVTPSGYVSKESGTAIPNQFGKAT